MVYCFAELLSFNPKLRYRCYGDESREIRNWDPLAGRSGNVPHQHRLQDGEGNSESQHKPSGVSI